MKSLESFFSPSDTLLLDGTIIMYHFRYVPKKRMNPLHHRPHLENDSSNSNKSWKTLMLCNLVEKELVKEFYGMLQNSYIGRTFLKVYIILN